jgi:hypothetical protein
MSGDVFWPSGPNSVYNGQNIQTIMDYVVTTTESEDSEGIITFFTDYELKGWKKQQLQDNFTEIIKKIGKLEIETIIENYNSNTKVSGILPLKSYFAPSSNVMYGSPNSLIISLATNLNNSTLNSFAFNRNDRNRDNRWASLIDWNGYQGSDAIAKARKGDAETILKRNDSFFDYKSVKGRDSKYIPKLEKPLTE